MKKHVPAIRHQGPSNFTNVEEGSTWGWEGYDSFSFFTSFKFDIHFFQNFCWKMRKGCTFLISDSINFEYKVNSGKLWYPFLRNTLHHNYTKFQAPPLTVGTQNACLKRPCFGEIGYQEKGQNISGVQTYGTATEASVMDGPSDSHSAQWWHEQSELIWSRGNGCNVICKNVKKNNHIVAK